MEWIERLNDAIGYIEEHLTDEMDYEQLGRLPVVLLIIFRGCLPIWRGFLYLNISVGGKCHLPL